MSSKKRRLVSAEALFHARYGIADPSDQESQRPLETAACIDGKTVTRFLSDDQLEDYQPWFDNHRRLRALVTELEALSQAIADADPRWNRRPARRTRQTSA
jgi:hypothetical protein